MDPKEIPLNERIILALDFESPKLAMKWVRQVESHIKFFKVGLQLFMSGWFHIVDSITSRGHKVMLDLKFFDIPETVGLAVKQLRDRGVTFATVHGNDPILEAAVREKGDLSILAITALTSFGEEDMREMFGAPVNIEDLVLSRARRALSIGCSGVVCSGLEAGRLQTELGDSLLIVTPGIRPGANREVRMDDQKRIVTAGDAIAKGADYLVVGRPITSAPEPIAVIEAMQSQVAASLRA